MINIKDYGFNFDTVDFELKDGTECTLDFKDNELEMEIQTYGDVIYKHLKIDELREIIKYFDRVKELKQ